MSDAQRYRENAAECERLALKSVGESTRASFRKMAAEWRALAADAERRDAPFQAPPSAADDSKETR
jgi:hypothetical protein